MNEIVSERLNQPFESAALPAEATATGGVASYLNANVAAALWFPARSVHVPERDAEAVSGPPYETGALQVSGPETSPAACANETVSARLNQPFASAARSADATAWGAVASYLNETAAAALRLPARSVQVPEREALASSGPL